MPDNREKETRQMNVTLPKEEFAKLDRGETHSNNGIRYDNGSLSAIPDIQPINNQTDNNTSRKSLAVKKPKPIESPQPIVIEAPVEEKQEETLLEKTVGIAAQTIAEQLVREEFLDWAFALAKKKAKQFWRWLNDIPEPQIATSEQGLTPHNSSDLATIDAEDNSIPDTRIDVSEETAFNIIEYAKYHARELAKTVHLLQNICIKDEITGEERVLRDHYIQELIEDEARQSMEFLSGQDALLDEGTRTAFADFLNGYIRNGDRLIPIPLKTEPCDKELNHEERDPGT